MTPAAAVLLEWLGVARILLLQAGLSLLAALVESRIKLHEVKRADGERFSPRTWWRDVREAARYLKRERGLRSIYFYMAVTNGVGTGYSPLLVAFFRTAAGMTAAMYSLFSAAEFIGRSIGGAVQYRLKLSAKKKFGFTFGVYQLYETMDMALLWLPYSLMLLNRACAGFFGINSATMRQAAVQRYLPEELRSRINAFENMCAMAASSGFSLVIGALGEMLDYRLCVTLCGAFCLCACWLLIWRNRASVRKVYESAGQ